MLCVLGVKELCSKGVKALAFSPVTSPWGGRVGLPFHPFTSPWGGLEGLPFHQFPLPSGRLGGGFGMAVIGLLL